PAEDGIRDRNVTGVQTCALPIFNKTKTLRKTPDQGLTAPLLMFVAVRAIAPVAGIPPNKGVMILAKPCPNNSLFDRCCFPVMPSATTAESKDSIPPSMAITKAGCQR